VSLVRDPRLAQLSVLVTSLPTGSGGRAYTIELTGRDGASPRVDTVTVTASSNDTELERRDRLARALKVALLPFLRGDPVLAQLDVTHQAPAAGSSATRGARDPWNLWVFRVELSGNADGDDNYGRAGADGGLAAGRVTEDMKIDLKLGGSYARSRYELGDGTRVEGRQRTWSGRGLVVKSLGPHLSLGVAGAAGSSSFENTTLDVKLTPAVEWDLFPYREATQRQVVVRYSAGFRAFRYADTTIYGRIRERRPMHELAAMSDVRRPWGTLWGSALWSEYLHDRSRRRATLSLGVDWRIVAGLTLNAGGQYARIRDQLNISTRGLSPEERLLRLRELQSGSSFGLGVGLSYTFGSVFNNVVNPRFRL
jgi:hypothetical protein